MAAFLAVVVGAVGTVAVGMAAAARLRACACRVLCCECGRTRMLPSGAATAVIVGDRGQEAGRQMHNHTQGYETATHYGAGEHSAGSNKRVGATTRPRRNCIATYLRPMPESTMR